MNILSRNQWLELADRMEKETDKFLHSEKEKQGQPLCEKLADKNQIGINEGMKLEKVGSRLCFKSRELAEYAGRQFIDLYKEFMIINNNETCKS